MFRLKPVVLGICSASFLAGCAWNNPSEKERLQDRPVIAVRDAVSKPDDMYQLGRYYQGQMRYDAAAQAYRKALAVDPNFFEAHNGLGVVYSLQGNQPGAIEEFNTAITLNPNGAHLYNNLGYVYLVQGDTGKAVAAFEKALAIEPGNQKAMNNLSAAYEKMGKAEKARQMSELATEAAAKAEGMPVGMTKKAASDLTSGVRVVQVSPNVYELRTPARPASHGVASGKPFRLEISNGNGVNGMARQVAGFIRKHDMATARLTNQKPFNQQATEIQYRSGYRAEADSVNSTLPRQAALVETSKLRQDISVRLVLGKDLVRDKASFTSNALHSASRFPESSREN